VKFSDFTEGSFDIQQPCKGCGTILTSRNRVDVKEFEELCHTCYSKKPKHVYVDFDGVLAEYEGWKGPEYLGPPRPGCKEFLTEIKSLGFTVVIFSTRRPGAIQVWLRTHDLWHLVSKVTNEKGPALVYIDRNICSWATTGRPLKLRAVHPHWKNAERYIPWSMTGNRSPKRRPL
jgi:hypothetical protein